MADNMKNVHLHIVMCPWLAFGHMIPFLELSKYLARRGHCISYATTPRNLQRLPKIPPNLSNLISFVSLPLPNIVNDPNLLPPNAEATSDITFDKIQYLKIEFDGLIDTSLSRVLEASPPDWIIYDFPGERLSPIAAKLNIPCAYFCTGNASGLAFCSPPTYITMGDNDDDKWSRSTLEHYLIPPKWVSFPTNIVYRYYEAKRWFDFQENASRSSDFNRMGSTLSNCQVLFVRSYTELEGEWLNLLHEVHRKPVIPVGMLRPPSDYEDNEEDGSDEWLAMRKWLDKQKENSVVYVAFGSEVTLSQEEMRELAVGLESSNLPFFWAMRKPHGSTRDDSTYLPDGFEDRVKGHSFICTGWVPQLRILGHPSVGCFVTHCGWSSILEGLAKEKALVLFPVMYDQPLVARLVVEKKLGVEIQRDERDGSFTGDSVVDALKVVMVKEEGELLKNKAVEMKNILEDMELQNRHIDNIERFLVDHRRE